MTWSQTRSVQFPPKNVDAGTAVAILDACIETIERDGIEDPEAADLRKRIHDIAEAAGVKPRDAFRVLYIAILGVPAGLPVIESMVFLGKERSLERLRAARARLV